MDDKTTRGEFALIDFIRKQAAAHPAVRLGIGDDCAVVEFPGGLSVLTTDLIIETVHFESDAPLRKIGWKAAAVSFSDVAAMGLRPEVLVTAAGLPDRFTMDDAKELVLGLNDICQRYNVAMAGGDTTSSSGPLTICTTVLGRAGDLAPVLRSGAQPGDAILVTGSLGGSILGRHLDVEPRIDEAVALNANFSLHSMIDLSDGLSSDLHHILEESNAGAVIYANAVPISDAARQLSQKTGKDPLQHALSDGEDFELLFTMPQNEAQRLMAKPIFDTPVAIVGRIEESGCWLEEKSNRLPLKPQGYQHFR